jgi:predicted PurR-regulated permease PerM
MKLDKDNIKKIRGLILFTIFVLVVLWNYELVFDAIGFLWGVILPFVIGGAIAFVVKIPMNFFEDKIFGKAKEKEKKWALKTARPLSLILTLLVVFGIIGIVGLVVVPELGRTIMNLGKTVQDFIPVAKEWALKFFDDNEKAVKMISNFEIKWDSILKNSLDFLKSGATSVLGSTYEAAKSIINGVTTFFIAFVFACYILVQKEMVIL